MVAPVKSALEDAQYQLQLLDFSGGLATETNALALNSNQTPDALNVFSIGKKLKYRGGYALFCALASTADQAFTFVDHSGVRHLMIWTNGTLYDCRTGVPVSIDAASYTAGQQIGVETMNNASGQTTLVWTALGVPIRFYDGTTAGAVVASIGTVPSGNYLMVYNGQLVVLQPQVGATQNPSAMMWSNVNDYTAWPGGNIQFVGNNDGSTCQWAVNIGVPSFVVGKSQGTLGANLFTFSGALVASGTSQTPISCAVGAKDPNSAILVPNKGGLGMILFLASDNHFWMCNGVDAWNISEDILRFVEGYVQNAVLLNPQQKFFSTYYTRWQYYICSIGLSTFFVYRISHKEDVPNAWWLFQGWPNGPFVQFIGTTGPTTGLPVLYTAANNTGQNGLYQVALDQTSDNGAAPNAYYTTPYLHGGKIEREKQFDWLALDTYNVGVQYTITGVGQVRPDGIIPAINALTFQDVAITAPTVTTTGVWDVSVWDTALWGGGLNTQAQPYPPCGNHAPLRVASLGSKWVPAGEPFPFKSGSAQFKISWSGGIPDFQVIGLNIRYTERSYQYVGNQPGQAVGGVLPFNPYSNAGPT
jgi:hypothetical protein